MARSRFQWLGINEVMGIGVGVLEGIVFVAAPYLAVVPDLDATKPDDIDHLPYNRQALAIIDRIAKLHGIDAPQTLNVTTPSAEKITEYVGTVVALYHAAHAQEADIIDAEIEE